MIAADGEIIADSTAGNIFGALAKIQAEVGAVGKHRKNTQQGYNFRGIDDIYQACQLIMAKHGVVSVPVVVSQAREERKTSKGSTWYWVALTMDFTFYAADGSHVTARTVGEALDSGDKASNKAMSQAEKYALIQTFKIPTDEPRDTENDSPEPDAGRATNGVHVDGPNREAELAQARVQADIDKWTPFLASIRTPQAATAAITEINEDLVGESQKVVKRLLLNRAKELGYVYDTAAHAFVVPEPAPEEAA